MSWRTWNGPLLPRRNAHIYRVVKRVREAYGLAPTFWKVRPGRVNNLDPSFGNGEDRQDAMALIVGFCLQRGIQRKELADALGVANGTIGRYSLRYDEITEETKRLAIQFTGELASKARLQFQKRSDDGTRNPKKQ